MRGLSMGAVLVGLSLSALLGCRKQAVASGNEVDTGVLIKQLKDPVAQKRQQAAGALARSGAAAKPAVGALTEALRDSDDYVRMYAAEALGQIGSEAASAVPALVLVMQKDSYGTARSQAALSLGNIGPGARSAVPSLMEALSEKTLVESAAASLDKIGEGVAAAQRLTSVVKDTTAAPEARAAAIMGLKKAGDRKAAVSLMISIIEDKGAPPEMRRAAALAVGHMGYDRVEEAKRAIPALLANLDQPDVCDSGPWSLWALGAAEPAVARLTELVRHRDPKVRAKAASGLASMAGGNAPPEAKAAVPALIEALKTKDDARQVVIYALGEIGPDAKDAVPALMALRKDDDSWTRDRVNEAIKKIAPNQ
jgi:HEAT repeat protein